jgi:F0F1-type ATP synthase membrane subunit b/b'|tara:strand:- start:780 stop:1031 length:252 start_codon:yes stop_codon:yes gene_type:complete
MTKSKEALKYLDENHKNALKKSYAAISQAMRAAKAKDSELFAKYKSELAEIRVVAEKKIGVTLTNDQCLAYVMHWFLAQVEEE